MLRKKVEHTASDRRMLSIQYRAGPAETRRHERKPPRTPVPSTCLVVAKKLGPPGDCMFVLQCPDITEVIAQATKTCC